MIPISLSSYINVYNFFKNNKFFPSSDSSFDISINLKEFSLSINSFIFSKIFSS